MVLLSSLGSPRSNLRFPGQVLKPNIALLLAFLVNCSGCNICFIFYMLLFHNLPPSTVTINLLFISLTTPPFMRELNTLRLIVTWSMRKSKVGLFISFLFLPAQLANVLTKPLLSPAFGSLISKLGLCDIHSPACGGILPGPALGECKVLNQVGPPNATGLKQKIKSKKIVFLTFITSQ